MALNVESAITSGLSLVIALVNDLAAAKAQAGASASVTTELVDLVEVAIADANVKSSISALIAAL